MYVGCNWTSKRELTALLEYFDSKYMFYQCVFSIRVFDHNFDYKSMGFTYMYPDEFTYLNTFVIQVAQRCSDNGGPTVL